MKIFNFLKNGIIIENKIFPFGNFAGITLYPFIFLKQKTPRILLHERIHIRQQLETGIIFFYLWYGIEFLIKFILLKDFMVAYRNISFEREAYMFEDDEEYLKQRKLFKWIKFLRVM